jgi:hypothetical protein
MIRIAFARTARAYRLRRDPKFLFTWRSAWRTARRTV